MRRTPSAPSRLAPLLPFVLPLLLVGRGQAGAGEPGSLGSSDQAVRAGALVPSAPPVYGPPPTIESPPNTGLVANPPKAEVKPPPATTAPTVLPPPRLVNQRRYNLVILGSGLLLATWGADRLLARDLPDSSLTWLPWIPIVGPWYLLSTQQQLAAPSAATSALLVFDGLLQAGGLTVGILGFVLHKQRLVMSLPPPAPVPTPP